MTYPRIRERLDQGKADRQDALGLIAHGHGRSELSLDPETSLQIAGELFTHSHNAITITDTHGTIIAVNDSFTRITGYGRADAVGQNPRILKSGRHDAHFYAALWQALADDGYWAGEIWNRRKDGEEYTEWLTITAIRDSFGRTTHYVGLFTDVSLAGDYQRQVEYIAYHDTLTGLPNRALLVDRLRHCIVQAQRHSDSLAVVYVGLDDFKTVNDLHGREVGDALLVALSQRMTAALRDGDIFARVGGDEFVAVLTDLELPQDWEDTVSRLMAAASQPIVVQCRTIQISASVGVALFPQDESYADLLLRHADQAMYSAKQAGKNRCSLFDVAQDEALRTQRKGVDRIAKALAQREFVLHFQPKVDLGSGALVGVEALIRWQHPERGLVYPADFLPLIEDHELDLDLGEWVIDAALEQMTEWRSMGRVIPVSVNVGAGHLQRSDFPVRLQRLMAAYPAVPPTDLELEVLESTALGDIDLVSEVMRSCCAMGIRFALDDFGTGYSSLAHLRYLPAASLKIDRQFVCNMLNDANDRAIVSGVIGLAKVFERGVIAEGVETAAHAEELRALGCTMAQGYGIARPMPASELLRWVDDRQSRMPAAGIMEGMI